MQQEVEAAFAEMLDISTDIDKAVVFGPTGVIASNMSEAVQAVAVAEAAELTRLGEESASHMGCQPLTQIVVETPQGLVFLVREPRPEGITALATGKRGSRVGLVLYDLKTCLRDAREAVKAGGGVPEGEEA